MQDHCEGENCEQRARMETLATHNENARRDNLANVVGIALNYESSNGLSNKIATDGQVRVRKRRDRGKWEETRKLKMELVHEY